MIHKDPFPDQRVQAEPLRQALLDAQAALQLAQLKHEHAMEIAADVLLSDDGIASIRHAGAEYAAAVTRYTNAAMAWLSFADTYAKEAKSVARKRGAGG